MKITFEKAVEILKSHEVFIFDETSPIHRDFLTFEGDSITVDLGGYEAGFDKSAIANIKMFNNRLEFTNSSDKIVATFDVYAPKNLV